jgi:hypothetical protein
MGGVELDEGEWSTSAALPLGKTTSLHRVITIEV